MEFEVSFMPKGESLYQVDRKTIGLDLIEKVRQDLEKEIPLDKFKGYIGKGRRTFSLVEAITEELARESGHFRGKNSITVEVENNLFNKFIYEDYEVIYDEEGEIEEVKFYYSFDAEAMLKNWKENDFPLDWEAN